MTDVDGEAAILATIRTTCHARMNTLSHCQQVMVSHLPSSIASVSSSVVATAMGCGSQLIRASLSSKVFYICLLALMLCTHRVSCRPGASIDTSDPRANDAAVLPFDDQVDQVWKRDTLCRRGSTEEDRKWDACERCARTTRSRQTFRLCCSGDAEDFCRQLLEYRPAEFNKRPRSRRTPVNYNRLIRSVLAHRAATW